MEKIKNVKAFCSDKGVLVQNLSSVQKSYAERLLEKYTWQTSARYIALVCHPKYGTGSNVALLLEDFYNSEQGKEFKESKEKTNQIEFELAKEFDSPCVKEKVKKTPYLSNKISPSSKKTRQLSSLETQEIRQLLTEGWGMQRISDRYNCSLVDVRTIRDTLRSEDPGSYQVFPKKNKGTLCVKNNIRRKTIKKCIFDHPECSFYQISGIAKAGTSTVMSAWIEAIKENIADAALTNDLPDKRFTNHRKLAREEINWALKKYQQGWTIDSVAYALKIHVNCMLKYLK